MGFVNHSINMLSSSILSHFNIVVAAKSESLLRIFTIKRVIVFILLCTVGLVWAIIEHAKPLTVKLLNNLLADYHIEVLNFDAEYVSLNHIRIPRLILKIEDSHIAVQAFNLELRDSIQMLRNQQFNADDIVSIKTQSVYVDLGESFFIRQSQQTEDSPATLQLNLTKLPTVNLGQIDIRLPTLNDNQASKHRLTMDNLTLSKAGQLDTLWRFDNYPLFSVNATLGKRAWEFDTQVDLGLSYQGLDSLKHYLALLNDNSFNHNANNHNLLKGLHSQLSSILQPIDEQQLTIEGQWRAHTTLDLVSATLNSHQSISDLSLRSARWASVYFAPENPINFMLTMDQYPVRNPLAANDSQTETSTFLGLSLNLAPFEYQLAPNKADFEQFIDLLVTDTSTKTQIRNVLAQLSPTNKQPQLSITVPEPIEVRLPLNNSDIATLVSIPKVSLELDGHHLQSLLTLHHLQANTDHQWRSQFEWNIELNSNKIDNNAPTFDLTSWVPELEIEQFSFEKSVLNLNGEVNTPNDDTIAISINPSSTLAIDQIIYSDQQGDKSTHKIQKNIAVQLAHLSLSVGQNSTINLHQNIEINLAPFSLAASKFIGQQIVNQTGVKSVTTYATAKNASIEIKQPTLVSINDQETAAQALQRWLQSPATNSVTWKINQLDAAKQIGKSRKQPLVALNNVTVNQALNLSKGLLVGSEQWQLDTLALSSYHLLKFADEKSPLSLAGQWTFDTDIDTALSTLKKVQPLPTHFSLHGHSRLIAGFALSELNNASQFEMKIQQQLSSLSGRLADKSFIGGDVFAQCQFNWQQQYDKPDTPLAEQHFAQSQLVCPQTAISVEKANVGILLTNLNMNANIELNKDGNKEPTNWLQQLTGLSETNVSLTASGDMLDGRFLLPEFVLKLHEKSHGYLLLQELSLATLLEEQPQVGVKASGIFDGVLPAEIVDGKVTISGGKLAARAPGGLIEVAGNPAMEQLALSQPYLELVFTALEHLNYTELASTFDMTPNGDASIYVGVKGKSRDIERPVHLNYDHQENLIQLYKSTQIGNQLQNKIETKVQ